MRLDIAMCINVIATGNDIKLFIIGINRPIKLDLLGKNCGVITLTNVKSFAFNTQFTTAYIMSLQLSGMNFGCPCTQDGMRTIDESATIDRNAAGIGNDDVCTLTCDFNIAIEFAWIITVDLIDDNIGFTFDQVRVAGHPASDMRDAIFAAIVEYSAFVIDIELAVLVERYTTG